jgi:DNA-binding GntR family transcriptional regulator
MNIYAVIVEAIRRSIETGSLKPGDKIPSMTQLAAAHGCSLNTVRSALLTLRVMGLTEGRSGEGTFVKEQP